MSPLILVLDDNSDFELTSRRAFDAFPVKIRQVHSRQDALLIEDDIQILLIASDLKDENAYELASDLVKYYPSAALYFIEDSNYNSQMASDCGALGYFSRSISPNELREALSVFLQFDESNSPTITPVSQLNFSEDFDFGTDQQMYEQLEQLLKVQLLTNVNVRQVIRQVVQEMVQDFSDLDQK